MLSGDEEEEEEEGPVTSKSLYKITTINLLKTIPPSTLYFLEKVLRKFRAIVFSPHAAIDWR